MLQNRFSKLFTALAIAGLTVSSQAAPYQLIDLGNLGGTENFAFAINNLNQVAGNANGAIVPADQITEESTIPSCQSVTGEIISREFCSHSYLYSNEVLINLGNLDLTADGGDFRNYAYGINDNSTVVGYGFALVVDDANLTKREVATISYAGGAIMALPFPAEALLVTEGTVGVQRALDINNDGKVVGYALINNINAETEEESTQNRPYLYDINTETFTIIPLFSDEVERIGVARAINTIGQVVGIASSEDEFNPSHAFMWDPASPELSVDLGALGGFTSGAYDINDNGLVVGVTETAEDFFLNEKRAFIYDASLTEPMILIPEFSDHEDFDESKAFAINNSNQVVGIAQITSGFNSKSTAFRYDYDTQTLINLNDMVDCSLGWELIVARDINENGYITGTGTVNGEVHSFLLVPTEDIEPTNCTAIRKQAEDDKRQEELVNSGSTNPLIIALLTSIYFLRRRFI